MLIEKDGDLSSHQSANLNSNELDSVNLNSSKELSKLTNSSNQTQNNNAQLSNGELEELAALSESAKKIAASEITITAKFKAFMDKAFSQENRTSTALALSIGVHIVAILAIKSMNLTDKLKLEPIKEETYVDLGYEQFDEPPQIVETKVDQPEETPDEPPTKMDSAPVQAQEMQDQASDVAGLQKEQPKETPKPVAVQNANVTDVPYYKIKPKYPKDALSAGLEGHVMLEVDITPEGMVENVRTIGGEQINIFESEARKAVAKWKYKPFTDGSGSPIKKANHIVKVDFKLVEQQVSN